MPSQGIKCDANKSSKKAFRPLKLNRCCCVPGGGSFLPLRRVSGCTTLLDMTNNTSSDIVMSLLLTPGTYQAQVWSGGGGGGLGDIGHSLFPANGVDAGAGGGGGGSGGFTSSIFLLSVATTVLATIGSGGLGSVRAVSCDGANGTNSSIVGGTVNIVVTGG